MTKRWPKSVSKASASRTPSFSMTTKLRQSTALYSLSAYFLRYSKAAVSSSAVVRWSRASFSL